MRLHLADRASARLDIPALIPERRGVKWSSVPNNRAKLTRNSFAFPDQSGAYHEFPVLPGDVTFVGPDAAAGPHRVVISQECGIQALVTHEGAPTYSGFVGCRPA